MATNRRSLRPGVDRLEGRRVLSRSTPSLPAAETSGLLGDVDGNGRLELEDEQAFTVAFLSTRGQANYNPAADLNHNGTVGQVDGRLLQRQLAPLIAKGPLKLILHLAPGQQLGPPLTPNSGGETYRFDVTIVGKTKPGALIYTDTSLGDYKFNGPAFAANAQGVFREDVHLTEQFTNFNFNVVDPYGHRIIRAFPILRKTLD